MPTFSEDTGFRLSGTTVGSSLATPAASDEYCSGAGDYQQPWPEAAPGGQTIGPVTALLPVEIFVAETGLETGVWHPIQLLIDRAAIETTDATVATLRATSSPEAPSLLLAPTGNGEGAHELTLALPPGEVADGKPLSLSAMSLLHEPGCHQFEVEIGDDVYGPFALEVIIP